MICCKITANFNSNIGDFEKLCQYLDDHGSIMWANNNLFFGSLENDCSKKTISTIMKKSGYKEFFIQEFCRITDPKEDQHIMGWLWDYIIKITVKTAENTEQKEFGRLAEELDQFNKELSAELSTLREQEKTQEG